MALNRSSSGHDLTPLDPAVHAKLVRRLSPESFEITQREEDGNLIGRCTVWVKKSLLDSILNKETNYFSVTVLAESST